MNAQTEPARKSQTEEQLSLQLKHLEALDMVTSQLCQRLQSVVDDRPTPKAESQGNAPEPTLCPLANMLRENNRRLEGLAATISRLHRSIEL